MQALAQKSLIIFDLDGTLIDSVPDLASATNGMLMALGASGAEVEQVRTWVGNGSKVLVERALAWANLPKSDEFLYQAHELFLDSYAQHADDKTTQYQGVTQGLTRLEEAGLTLALATNKPLRFVPAILQKFGWTDKFSMVLGGDSLPVKKPDPLPLLHICECCGVLPSQAIMVGDSKNDVQAGKNANITTLALTYGYNYGEPIANSLPDGVFDSFDELTDFILASQDKISTK